MAAGTASMIEQNPQKSSTPIVASARSTIDARREGIRSRDDHRPVHALQEVRGDHREAAERQGTVEQRHRLDVLATHDVHLGEPLQRVGLAGDRAEVTVEVGGLAELAGGEVEIAGEQRRLADERRGERDGAQRTAALRGAAHAPSQVDHLGVRSGPVEHVLRGAQVAVEERVGDLGRVSRASQLDAHAIEPLAPPVREQALQRHEVEHLPVVVSCEDAALGLVGDAPRQVEVAAVVGDVALGEQHLGIVRPAVGLHPFHRGDGRGDVARHHRRPREPRPQQLPFTRRGGIQRFPVGRHGRRIADRHQQVAAQREHPRAIGAAHVGPDRIEELERVAVRTDRRRGLGRPEQVTDGARPARWRGGSGIRSAPATRRAPPAARRRRGG